MWPGIFVFIVRRARFIIVRTVSCSRICFNMNSINFSVFSRSQIFLVWISLRYWPTATTPHQRISITCHSCRWAITVHRWWVRECRRTFDRIARCWRTTRTYPEWRRSRGNLKLALCWFYIKNVTNWLFLLVWRRSGIWENCRAAYEDIVKHLER